jgi:glycosyltransferase involved in cell wall biosynthesis
MPTRPAGAIHPARPVRVTLATRIFTPEPAAASFRLDALVTALSRSGAQVDVLTVSDPRAVPAERRTGVRVRRWPVWRDRTGYVRGYLRYLSFDLPLVVRLAFTRRPDVVVAEPPPTTGAVVRAIAGMRGIPYVYYAADIWSDAARASAPGPVVYALRRGESWALRGAAQVVAVSPGVAQRARALGASRVEVVPGGIDTDTFCPDGPRVAGAPTGPYAVYAGTASEWQGADIFVRAMARVRAALPGAVLVVVGQGSGWADLQRAAACLPDGACVRLLPPVSAAQAAAWQRGAHLAVVSLRPGLGYDFALPTKLLAAVACGTPVLFAGPAGAASELIAAAGLGQAGAYDEDAVADAMAEALAAGPGAGRRAELAAWAVAHASAGAAGQAVAAIVCGVGRRS